MLSSEEVKTAYKLILRRAPENDAIVEMRRGEESLESLAQVLMQTPEFRRLAAFKQDDDQARQWVCAQIRKKLRIWLDLNDYGVAAGVLEDDWERDETNFILSNLEPGDLFVDVGANIGWFTILACDRVGSAGRVIAFEARSDLAERLQLSIEENGFASRCAVHATALGDHQGSTQIASIPSEHNPGHSFLVTGAAEPGAMVHGTIKMEKLDAFKYDRPIKVLKIDVEGAEHLVLKGGVETISSHKPVIVMELFPKWLRKISGVDPQETLELLLGLGYSAFHLTAQGVGREVHSLTRQFTQEEYFNLVFLASNHAGRLLDGTQDDRVRDLEARLNSANAAAAAAAEEAAAATEAAAQIGRKLREHEAQLNRQHREEAQRAAKREQSDSEEKKASAQLVIQRGLFEMERRQLEGVIASLTAENNAIRQSTTWRMTEPVRRLGDKLPPKFRRRARQGLKLIWWTVTLQLAQRIRERRRMLAPARAEDCGSRSVPDEEPQEAAAIASQLQLAGPIALIVDDRWPQPDRDGGSVDAINLVNALKAEGYSVCFCTTSEHTTDSPYKRALAEGGVNCIDEAICSSAQSFIEIFGRRLSVVFLTRVGAGGQYLELLRYNAPQAKVVFNTVDLHYLREQRQAALSNDPEAQTAAESTKVRELFLTANCDATIVVSATEKKLLLEQLPAAKVHSIPLGRQADRVATRYEERSGIGFIGGFAHQPNVDAVTYFLADIWPLVMRRLPGVEFTIVGAGLDESLVQGHENVRYLGFQPDIAPWFNSLRLTIAPLRYGAGMKGKVISSLAYGVPCVGTSIAFEGMDDAAHKATISADDPQVFADAVCRIYEDQADWTARSVAGIDYANAQNSVRAFDQRIHLLLNELELPTLRMPPLT